MNSIKAENDDDDEVKVTNLLLNSENMNSLEFFDYIIQNRENIKSASENIKEELSENKTSPQEINNSKEMTSEISFVIDALDVKSKITPISSNTSVKKLNTLKKDTFRSVTYDNITDSSKIHVSCRFCKKGFETLKTMNNHDCRKQNSISIIKAHKCNFCSLTFSQKKYLTTHLKNHTRNNCTLCDAQFTKRKALCKHLLTAHAVKEPEKLYKCSFCEKHFSKRLTLNFHMKSHINNQYFCLKCCFNCDDEDMYTDHVKQHMKNSNHECNLCQKKFVRRQQYDQHMMAHEKYLCSSCNLTFSNKKLFMKHQHSVHNVENEKKHACLICKKLFSRPKYLEIHQRVHTGEKPVKCFHCEKNFFDSKSLLKHMKTVKHLQRVSSQKGQKIEIEKLFLCSKCGVRFHRQQSLLRHIEIIHSTMEFLKCPHCDYKSKCKTNYKRHLELHTDVKRFICEWCGSSFRALATLKEHCVFVHSGSREFICEICKKSFKNKSTLQRHMRIHSESRPYKCFCNRDYKRMSHLKRHMSSAHQITLKKNQVPTTLKENANLDSSLSEENITALIKSLEAIPDESSCDDISVSHYITSESNNQAIVHDDSPVSPHHATTLTSSYCKPLNSLSINGNSNEDYLQAKTDNNAVPLNSMQKLHDSCDVYFVNEDSKNTLKTFDLNQNLKVPSINGLSNSETSSISLDDATLSLSPSNYCNASSPLSTIPMEDITILSHSLSPHDVHSLSSDDNIPPQSSPNLNFQTPISNIDSFVTFSNTDSPTSLPAPPFSLNSSPSHVTDLEQNASQRQLFGDSEDFLSLPSYASDEFEAPFSPEQFFISWNTNENNNTLNISNNDLTIPSTCANIFPSSLSYNVNNLPKDLFANNSLDVTTSKPDFDSFSDLC